MKSFSTKKNRLFVSFGLIMSLQALGAGYVYGDEPSSTDKSYGSAALTAGVIANQNQTTVVKGAEEDVRNTTGAEGRFDFHIHQAADPEHPDSGRLSDIRGEFAAGGFGGKENTQLYFKSDIDLSTRQTRHVGLDFGAMRMDMNPTGMRLIPLEAGVGASSDDGKSGVSLRFGWLLHNGNRETEKLKADSNSSGFGLSGHLIGRLNLGNVIQLKGELEGGRVEDASFGKVEASAVVKAGPIAVIPKFAVQEQQNEYRDQEKEPQVFTTTSYTGMVNAGFAF